MKHRLAWVLAIAAMFGACSGAAPPAEPPAPIPVPATVRKELPKAKSGVRTISAETVRKAFQAEAIIKGTNGRICGAWRDRIVLTQPNEYGTNDLRIRPRGDDLDEDCEWEGPVLIGARVEGQVVGVVWPHVVLFKPGKNGVGRLEVVNGTTGGLTAEIVNAFNPAYVRSFVVAFGVPIPAEVKKREDEACPAAIQRAWNKVLADLDSGGRIHPDMERQMPSCDPAALRMCEDISFMTPNEIVLTEVRAQPAAGRVGCIHMPER